MVEAKRVIWPQKARTQLRELYKYIKRDSPLNAEKVRKDILASTRELSKGFKLHQPDKYKEIMMEVTVLTKFIVIGLPIMLEKKILLL